MTTRYRAQAALPTCPEHPDENLDTYCTTCNKRVCEACRDEHKDHKWIRVNRLARMVRENAGSRCKDITDMLVQMKRAKISSSGKKQTEAIRGMQRKLVTMVNNYADTMVSLVESGDEDANISEEIRKLELMLDFFQNQLQTADENVIMEIEEEFHNKQEKLASVKSTGCGMKFEEGRTSSEVLHHMFGRVVKDISNQEDKSEVKVREKLHFTHVDESVFVNRICPISNNEAWIMRYEINQIDKVDKKGKVIYERKIPSPVDDFTVLDDEDIMYILGARKTIKIVSLSGSITDVCSTAPLRPKGICRSRDRGVLVCLVDCKLSNITTDSRGEIHLINKSGRILKKYSHTGDQGIKLFMHPTRISQNINMDICVIDKIDKEHRCRLVVVSTKPMIRFTYTGQMTLKKFVSHDVSCDDRGRIILTDLHNDAIHLLREDGEFLQYILTKQSPLYGPHSLALHNNTLWVGCENCAVRVYEYIGEKY